LFLRGGHGSENKLFYFWMELDEICRVLADIESELSDFTANCVKSPCTQENALRTFIQRRIMHELERQEETAQNISCMYLYSFYFNFSDKNG
jgi:hypothetical protein